MGKNGNIMQKRIDSEPKYNDKYLKTKIKSYDVKITTNLMIMLFLKKVLIIFVFH